MMNLINNCKINQRRKGGLPSNVKNDKNYTYGISSYFENHKTKDLVMNQNCNASMRSIMSHSDNLVEGLQQKISQKI